MAKLVTRTFTGTMMDVLVYDKENKNTDEITMVIPSKKVSNEKTLERIAKAQLKEMNENLVFVAVTRFSEILEKRTMTVQHFYEESEAVE